MSYKPRTYRATRKQRAQQKSAAQRRAASRKAWKAAAAKRKRLSPQRRAFIEAQAQEWDEVQRKLGIPPDEWRNYANVLGKGGGRGV